MRIRSSRDGAVAWHAWIDPSLGIQQDSEALLAEEFTRSGLTSEVSR